MISVFINVFLIFLTVVPLGLVVYKSLFRLVYGRSTNQISVFFVFVLGLLVISFSLGFYNIWFPINSYLVLFPILLSLLSTFFYKDDLVKVVVKNVDLLKSNKLLLFSGISLFLVFLMVGAIKNNGITDDASYYFQTILWIKNYKAVKGLGLLSGHFALGMGQAWFRLHTLFLLDFKDNGTLQNDDLNVALLILFSCHLLKRAYGGASNKFIYFVTLLTIPLLLSSLKGFAPDLPVAIIGICVVGMAYRLIVYRSNKLVLLLMLLFSFFLVTIKLSSLLILIFVLVALMSNRDKLRNYYVVFVIASLYGLFVTFVVLFTNLTTTGFPLYPLTYFDFFNFDWKMPFESVMKINKGIRDWPKVRYYLKHQLPFDEQSIKSYSWVRFWLKDLSVGYWMLLGSFFVPVIFIYKMQFKILCFYITLLMMFALWFVSSPNIRFAYYFFIPSSVFATYMFLRYYFTLYNLFDKFGVYVLSFFCITMLLFNFVLNRNKLFFYKQEKYTKYPIHKVLVNSSFLLNQPTLPANIEIKLCGTTELPCSFTYDNAIVLRGKSIEDGFKLK